MDELRDKLTKHLLESLASTQERSGRTVPELDEDTIPFLDLDGFDSHNGVEVEILLSERVGLEIENIPFHAGRRGTRELSVREIVEALLTKHGAGLMAAQAKSSNELVTN
jgi:hypothetical protein